MADLAIPERPNLRSPRMVLGFTGWMDGGHVSTGTVRYLKETLAASDFASIAPSDFYILHFPVATIPVSVYSAPGKAVVASVNPMEFAAVFRPHTRIREGLVEELTYPRNEFSCAEPADLILFLGEEPHIRWGAYCDCVFRIAREFSVSELYFVGSVAGPVPHTRAPRVRASVSSADLKGRLEVTGVRFTEYEGPASIVTALCHRAAAEGIPMSSLVLEIPHYPFLEMPTYPPSIFRAAQLLDELFGLALDLSDLSDAADAARAKLNDLLEGNAEFRQLVRELEAAYDREEDSADEELLRRLMEGIDLDGGNGQH